jgi:hypothetical protein
VYASEGTATVSTAASRAYERPTTRRATKNAGTAASDMRPAFIVFTAAYAAGRLSKRRYAGLMRSG